jgi:putative ABC transport system permease protein
MRTLLFDLRDAVRGLRRDYAYATTVIVTLALTLGATTAVFSIVDGILLKPLAYRDSGRLVALREVWHELAYRVPTLEINERHFEYWRSNAQTFEAMAQYQSLPANLTSGGDAAQVTIARTSSSLFDVLGVDVALGRRLTTTDEPPGQPDVAVISASLWRTRFGGNTAILGTPIVIDGKPFTVVGVLPADFRLPMGEQLVTFVDVFVPLRVAVGWIGDHNNVAIGRLRDGVAIEQARAELAVLQAQVSVIATRESGEPATLSGVVTPLAESIVGRSRRGLLLLFSAIVAVLLVACSNLANLSLARALGRVRDGAIRSALGASRFRLIRRVVLEQLVLTLAGATAGIWVASASLAIFVRTAPLDLPRIEDVTLDARVLCFATAVATAAALLVAILPAWHVASRDAQAVLRSGGTVVGADRAGMRMRSLLMSLQVAISVTLLVVTGLLGASLMRVLAIDRGFSSERVIAIPVALPASRYADDPSRIAVYDRILNEVRTLSAVVTVSPTSMLPLRGEGQVNMLAADGRVVPRSEQPSANFRFVAPEFFDTLSLRLERGRSFNDKERDPERPAPVVISSSVAARLWPSDDPLGQRFSRGIDGEQGFEVVGVAIDARTTSVERTPPLMVYVPYWWRSRPSTSLLVKTALDPAAIVPDVRRVIRNIDAEIAIGQVRLLDDVVKAASAGRRYQTQLFVAFGAVALFIATLGVYAVTAYSLSRRKREMNIRAALGAGQSDVLRLVTSQAAQSIGIGVGLGLTGALALGGTIRSLLYDVPARDPMVLAGVAATVGMVALSATVVAARQGISINPVAALRQE